MPNYQGIVINAATFDAKCSSCRRDLSEEAALGLTFGFKTSYFCPDCLTKALRGYPRQAQLVGSLQEAVSGLQKQIDGLKKEIKNGKSKGKGTSPKSPAVPQVRPESAVQQ